MSYKLFRGWATFAHRELSPVVDSINSSLLPKTCDGLTHYETDLSIAAIPVWKRISFEQDFKLTFKELTSSCNYSHTSFSFGDNITISFCAFPRTLDRITGLERVFTTLPLTSWQPGKDLTGNAAQDLVLRHAHDFSGFTYVDPFDPTVLNSGAPGLLTSILFGWRYSGVSGAILAGSASVAGVDLFVHNN